MNGLTRARARQVAVIAAAFAVVKCMLFAQAPTSRDVWQRPDDIVAALALTAGSRVADVGAGDRFFTARLARAVGAKSRVLAGDIDQKILERLKEPVQKDKQRGRDVCPRRVVKCLARTASDLPSPYSAADSNTWTREHRRLRGRQCRGLHDRG